MVFFRRYLSNLLPAFLFFIFCIGSAQAESEYPRYRYKKQDQEGSLISGRVLDGQTLKPVTQARVYLNNFPALSAMSDLDGYFQLETGPINYPSQLTLVCSGDDYFAREYPLNLVKDQEVISLGWIFLEKIEKTPAPEFSEVLLFGLLIDDSDGSAIKSDQNVSIADAPEVDFEIDRAGVFHTIIPKTFFDERAGKFLINTSAEEYATTLTDARLSPGLSYYDLGKIKLTYVGEPEPVITPVTPELPEVTEIPVVTEQPEIINESRPTEEVVTETKPVETVTEIPSLELTDLEGDGRELKDLQQAYFLLKTMESQGDFLDREGVDLLSMIFERYESPASARHLATLAEEESLTIPCINEGMQIYRSEYFARLSRMLTNYLSTYNLNEIRVDENQKFYRELLGTLAYLEDFYQENPEEPDRAAYENSVELYSNIISRYFKED